MDLILDYYAKNGRDTFQISKEYYWNISKDERYDPYGEPKEFTLGQLSWDLDHLRETLSGKMPINPQYFIWLGHLLIAIGETSFDTKPRDSTT